MIQIIKSKDQLFTEIMKLILNNNNNVYKLGKLFLQLRV